MSKSIVPDRELQAAFEGSDFGTRDHRKLLEASVLKKAAGFHCGHTITTIMRDLRLIGKNGNVLKRGRRLLGEAYRQLMQIGG